MTQKSRFLYESGKSLKMDLGFFIQKVLEYIRIYRVTRTITRIIHKGKTHKAMHMHMTYKVNKIIPFHWIYKH